MSDQILRDILKEIKELRKDIDFLTRVVSDDSIEQTHFYSEDPHPGLKKLTDSR